MLVSNFYWWPRRL